MSKFRAESASSSAGMDSMENTGRGAMGPTHEHLRQVADALITATNAFDVERALSLFAHVAAADARGACLCRGPLIERAALDKPL